MTRRPAGRGRIFISYRREDTAYPAGWLFDRLADHFGEEQIFKDVDSIEPGDDFAETITTAVGSCDVLLALIGDQWLTLADARGSRRLDDPTDFVRLEIEAALSRDVRVIPVLVGKAAMPGVHELPGSLAALVRRQALELSPSRFDADFGRLLRVLERTLAETEEEVGGPPPVAPASGAVPPPSGPEHPAPPPEHGQGIRRLLSTPRRLATAAAILVAALALVIGVLLSGDGDSPSTGDEPSTEEEAPAEEEGAWPSSPPPAHQPAA